MRFMNPPVRNAAVCWANRAGIASWRFGVPQLARAGSSGSPVSRAAIAFAVVLYLHIEIYSAMARPRADLPVYSEPPAMEAVLLEEQRPAVEPLPEPQIEDAPPGALDIPAPNVPNLDPAAVPSTVERPVDLPSANVKGSDRNSVSVPDAGDVEHVTAPHFDQAYRPAPAEVIAPHGSASPAAGSLSINAWVEASGQVSRAYVVRSSGVAWIDAAAPQYARTWRLRPGISGGVARGMWGEFTLLIAVDSCCTTLQAAH
jgi:TonB family protein